MQRSAEARPNVKLDAAGCVAQDIICVKCGYNLRGLQPEGICPECATPIGKSTQGEFLCYAPPEWVERLAQGANWIVASMIISIVGGCVSWRLRGPMLGLTATDIPLQLLGMIRVVGYWFLTVPDPARLADGPKVDARLVLRVAALTNYAGSWLLLVLYLALGPAGSVIAVVLSLVGVVEWLAAFIYARQLAWRIPSRRLAADCLQLMVAWILMGLLGVVAATVTGSWRGLPGGWSWLGCGVVTGVLVFSVLTISFILNFRREMAAAARTARATWAKAD